MSKLSIIGKKIEADVQTINEVANEMNLEKRESSDIMFFGNLDVSMKEIDAALIKLRKMTMTGKFNLTEAM
ncbi:MAG: hypothetical protein DKM22_02870 [Candidatus Melainabacteria bacterium]|nr:MAG: hypothetical protein DKM22_02870 [Candidatus Melainabacteria bacterium]